VGGPELTYGYLRVTGISPEPATLSFLVGLPAFSTESTHDAPQQERAEQNARSLHRLNPAELHVLPANQEQERVDSFQRQEPARESQRAGPTSKPRPAFSLHIPNRRA
jgi:hypothetical protein